LNKYILRILQIMSSFRSCFQLPSLNPEKNS